MPPLSFIRRRGADITQSLLYAALALVVVIVGFGPYRIVDTNVGERVESGKMGRSYTPIGINCDPEWTGSAQFQISYSIDD